MPLMCAFTRNPPTRIRPTIGRHVNVGSRPQNVTRSHRPAFVRHVLRDVGIRAGVRDLRTSDWLSEGFEAHRLRLRAVAYRLLGSLSEADDAVQDVWLD